jgi:hypothetical protein
MGGVPRRYDRTVLSQRDEDDQRENEREKDNHGLGRRLSPRLAFAPGKARRA